MRSSSVISIGRKPGCNLLQGQDLDTHDQRRKIEIPFLIFIEGL